MSARDLAAAIRKGIEMSRPTHERHGGRWIVRDEDGCFACVLGTAALAIGYPLQYSGDAIKMCKDVFGVDSKTLLEVHGKYETLKISREQCADWLDTLEPAQRQTFDSFMAAALVAVEVPMDSDTTASALHK